MIRYNLLLLKDTLAFAYQQKGDIDIAIEEYERLTIFDPDSRDRLFVHPKNYYRLVRLCEQKAVKIKP